MVTKKDILEAIGMETHDRFMSGMFIGIGLGALIGGAVALLVAPKSGIETREGLGGKVKDVMGKVRSRRTEEGFIPTDPTTDRSGI